jgi:hypothetical protein
MYDFIKIWDVYHYWQWASAFVAGQPFTFEYPTLAFLPMLLPRLLTDSYPIYALLFHIEMIGFAGIIALLLKKVLKLSPLPFLAIFLSLFGLLIELLDVYVALLTFVSILLFHKKKYGFSAIFLCLASATKIYPLILFPIFGLRLLKDRTKLIPFILSGILSMILIFSNPFSIEFHKERPVQPESIYGTLIYLKNPKTEIVYGHNAQEYKDIQLPLWFPIGILAFGFFRAIRQKSVFASSFYMILSFIVANKVLSPQYLIWIAPLIAFVSKRTQWIIIGASILTLWYLGLYTQTVVDRILPFPWILITRNLLLAVGLFI